MRKILLSILFILVPMLSFAQDNIIARPTVCVINNETLMSNIDVQPTLFLSNDNALVIVGNSLFVTTTTISTDIKSATTSPQRISKEKFFTVDGQEVSQPHTGLYIHKIVYEDGSQRVEKVIKK
jgi:hypothetical protein